MPTRLLTVYAVILAVLFGMVGSVVAAPRHLSGLLEWQYGKHTATENGTQVLDAGHFTQKYSFLWDKSGQFMRGKLGNYDVSLGYEWSWVDSYTGDHQKVLIDNPLDKILYKGDITIAPGGLPFKLRVYSHDLQSTSFVTQDLGQLFSLPNDSIQPHGGTITSIINGTSRETGATLTAGVQNGRYLGQYRDLLSALPRLLVDYRQVEVHDVKGPDKLDYIDRNLAFVSLNKKKNWFHYRVFNHTDRIDASQNYQEQSYLLGTIDQQNQRQWINLTNWIQVSSDISYSQYLSAAGQTDDRSRRYDLNLFTRARRTRWSGSNFTSYRRIRDINSLDRSIVLPFYAQGELNRATSWRFRTVGTRNQTDYISGSPRKTDDVFVSGRVETFRQSRYVFAPTVEFEVKKGTEGRGSFGHIGGEFYSNPVYRSDYDLFGSLDVLYFKGTAYTGTEVDYSEVKFSTKIQKDFNAFLIVGGEEKLVFGSGIYDSSVANNLSSDIALESVTERGSAFRSNSSVYAELTTLKRLRNRIEVSVNLENVGSLSSEEYQVDHRLDYSGRMWNLSIVNSYLNSDQESFTSGPIVGQTLTHGTTLNYTPNRAINTQLKFSYINYRANINAIETFSFFERFQYSVWHNSGFIRKLAVFGQEIETEKTQDDTQLTARDFLAFSLFTNYYPTSHSLLSARLRYDINSDYAADTFTCFLTAGLDFSKFRVSVDYSYGMRERGSLAPERKEQRWEVKVKKLF